MSVAFVMSLIIQATVPNTAPQIQPPPAPQAEITQAGEEAPPERVLRNRFRNEVASECQYRARTGSIRRRNICYTPRQLAAHNAVARKYVEEIQVGQSSGELPGGGPD
ncbi:hypothetical protein GCM10009093_22690 [Brevundimonas terrae]|uniref:UrcA family protein n=2 Tax=Brevundimonas terrae TaxID=363631 RepID=A0ABN0YHT5_9CAUL